MSSGQEQKTYVSNGEVVARPPASVQIKRYADDIIVFLVLYFTTLFSMDSYAAAANSPFSRRREDRAWSGSARAVSSAPAPGLPPNGRYNGAYRMAREGHLGGGGGGAPMPGPGSCRSCCATSL
ncbi:uncharacterized protein K452DRAFT_294792 [Aplosporella prunicola CBS 121167]|uniref:Uncharacterized protein n=1 Tax=Aplosporella prunicola CBS 121167 TaxID=1176127 RepID=A0A6A6BRV7_9PEZI|nr:uncharacterized protein K452DRAFT_294792 [Aplosporella prunicola CBS 121167]KAF2146203.1 hypothetical protein K452DRAFT_294792 [Aplosporella prunicola CBS 121167]